MRQLVAPHGWGNPAGRVGTTASPVNSKPGHPNLSLSPQPTQAATPPSPRSRRFAPEEVYFDDSYGISYEGIPQYAEGEEDAEGGERTHEGEGEGDRVADDGKKKKTRKKTKETAIGPQ